MELLIFFKSLADSVRLQIFTLLNEKGTLSVLSVQRVMGIPQPSVSRALIQLKKAGLLNSSKKGNQVFYSVNRDYAFYPALKTMLPGTSLFQQGSATPEFSSSEPEPKDDKARHDHEFLL
ncbi:MAG: metalloregulator ArsR/SmtB family transcription factor [Candidatus Wallbacteria bacterium]|nr:metalloregulator ArsR/SmtB family transcription factor [Candidatus Wallbacteria bacterium]